MVNQGMKSNESGSTKGYDSDDLCVMIQGLTLSIANIEKKIDYLNQNKIDVDDFNRAKDQFESGIKVALDLATEAKLKAIEAKKEATDIKNNHIAPSAHIS